MGSGQEFWWLNRYGVNGLPKPGKNERPAFEAEALDHFGELRVLSLSLTRNHADADDLVQDAYLRAFRAAEHFTPGTNLKAWLRTILRNVASNRRRDHYRARVRTNETEAGRTVETRPSGGASPEQALLSKAMEPRLRKALEAMPKALRDTVWLRDVEELCYAEIAQRLRIPVGTVMSRISRGRRLLHDRLLEPEGGKTL